MKKIVNDYILLGHECPGQAFLVAWTGDPIQGQGCGGGTIGEGKEVPVVNCIVEYG